MKIHLYNTNYPDETLYSFDIRSILLRRNNILRIYFDEIKKLKEFVKIMIDYNIKVVVTINYVEILKNEKGNIEFTILNK